MSILVVLVITGVSSIAALGTTVITLLGERGQRLKMKRREPSQKLVTAEVNIARRVHEKTLGASQGDGRLRLAERTGPVGKGRDADFDEAWIRASSTVGISALAAELQVLRTAMRERGIEPEHDMLIGEVANAQIAASGGDGPRAMSHLAAAGVWALNTAISIETRSAATAIEIAIGEVAPASVESAVSAVPKAPGRRLGLALAVIATAQLMVVLDATIVNVALPHIQDALHFSGTSLEWVVNAYALAFGGLLLLGGRSGDLLGCRRVFIAGIALFALASLAGGFATDQAWLLIARVVQGIGGAMAAPTSLALIAVTFPEGKERNRAMGVYAAMSISGAAIGLIAGGLLTSYLDWRWVFFVNVPIGLIVLLLAPRVLGTSEPKPGRFDLPGAIIGSLGLGALVYGLSEAATTFTNGQAVGRWGSTKVIVALVAAVVLLVAFGFIEARSRHALVPPRVLASRDRTGAYLISLCIGTALFGMFFFVTLFVQQVWGYSPVKSGVAYLPMVAAMMLAAGLSSDLVARIGARPLMLIGPAFVAGGMFWLSQLSEHSTYVGGLLGPMMLTGFGMGLTFVPLSLVALVRVADYDSGVASSLLNTGQQVGGSIGLAILGTVAWSAVASSLHSATAAAGLHVSQAQQLAISNHALTYGFGRGYLVSAGIALLAVIVSLVFIRVKKSDLRGIAPMVAPGA